MEAAKQYAMFAEFETCVAFPQGVLVLVSHPDRKLSEDPEQIMKMNAFASLCAASEAEKVKGADNIHLLGPRGEVYVGNEHKVVCLFSDNAFGQVTSATINKLLRDVITASPTRQQPCCLHLVKPGALLPAKRMSSLDGAFAPRSLSSKKRSASDSATQPSKRQKRQDMWTAEVRLFNGNGKQILAYHYHRSVCDSPESGTQHEADDEMMVAEYGLDVRDKFFVQVVITAAQTADTDEAADAVLPSLPQVESVELQFTGMDLHRDSAKTKNLSKACWTALCPRVSCHATCMQTQITDSKRLEMEVKSSLLLDSLDGGQEMEDGYQVCHVPLLYQQQDNKQQEPQQDNKKQEKMIQIEGCWQLSSIARKTWIETRDGYTVVGKQRYPVIDVFSLSVRLHLAHQATIDTKRIEFPLLAARSL